VQVVVSADRERLVLAELARLTARERGLRLEVGFEAAVLVDWSRAVKWVAVRCDKGRVLRVETWYQTSAGLMKQVCNPTW
jgi:hypothetical protein